MANAVRGVDDDALLSEDAAQMDLGAAQLMLTKLEHELAEVQPGNPKRYVSPGEQKKINNLFPHLCVDFFMTIMTAWGDSTSIDEHACSHLLCMYGVC